MKMVLYTPGEFLQKAVQALAKGYFTLEKSQRESTLTQEKRMENKIDDTEIADVQAGSNHILALTKLGEVYAWGYNNKGQVGCRGVTRIDKKKKVFKKDKFTIVGTPKKVYPPENYEFEDVNYNRAMQIVAYNDTSFCLTNGQQVFRKEKKNNSEEGELKNFKEGQDENKEDSDAVGNSSNDIYGWGYNEDGILLSKREMKFEPYRLKIKNSRIVRIEIQYGNFIGYLVEDEFEIEEIEQTDPSIENDFSNYEDYMEEKKDKIDMNLNGEGVNNTVVGKNVLKKINANKSCKSSKSNYSKMTTKSKMSSMSIRNKELANAAE